MSRRLQATLLAAAVALSPIPLVATSAPAAAQVNVSVNIGFDYFYDELAPYGEWNYHPRWGDVWRPVRVNRDFRPYVRGYWVNTEFGMTWESQDAWGDLTYHYGRWVYDPYDGWLWVPGYTWAPAWVVWRGDSRNIGWFPMPPDDRFLAGVEVYRTDWNWDRGYFGYSDWYGPSIATGLLAAWTFVALDHFADRDYYRYVQPRTQIVNIVNNTTNITNYVTVNNRIVNRSVDVTLVERASGRRIERVEARQVVRAPITTVDAGRQVQVRERERHGGDVRAAARERVQRLPAQEAKLPVQERRSLRGPRDQQQAQQPQGPQAPDADRGGRVDRNQQRDQQQAQQPQGPQPDADKGGRFERNQQREQQKAEPRGRVDRDKQGAIEPPQQPDRGAALQQQREEQQNRARAEQDRGAALQQQREEQQNRAAAERQQRDQAEQQNRARAEQQQQRAEQQNRAREEQGARAQQAERQQQAQAEQQNRARAQQAERQQQQQAAAEERQQRAKAKQQKEEEEKDRKSPN
jgi:Family of unknown function (DUF6600)